MREMMHIVHCQCTKWTSDNYHSCRTAMSASPKRRTGPNRNKTGRTGGVVFGRQKTVTDYASN